MAVAAPSRPRTDPDELPRLVAEAQRVQVEWRAVPPAERARVLRAAARVLRARADEIVASIVAETGKPRTEAIAHDLFAAVDHAHWLAGNASRVLRSERIRFPQLHLRLKRATQSYEPIGVVGVISPWNIPFGIPFTSVATNVAALRVHPGQVRRRGSRAAAAGLVVPVRRDDRTRPAGDAGRSVRRGPRASARGVAPPARARARRAKVAEPMMRYALGFAADAVREPATAPRELLKR